MTEPTHTTMPSPPPFASGGRQHPERCRPLFRPDRAAASLLLSAVVMACTSPHAMAAPDITLLHLSATGTVQAVPDLLVAHLTGEVDATEPGDAQRQLDGRMASAARLASATKGVSWRLEGFQTGRTGENAQGVPQGWTARQTLRLESADADALLDLVGRLQATNLAVGDLAWTLSAPRLGVAQAAATDLALKTLRHRAEAAATSLGLKVGTMRDVTLDADDPAPHPLMRMMAMKAAPQATEASQDVSETASAVIGLHP